MAAFRERYSARDGMGHADRPGLHYAFSLDAQSRGLCLSFARRTAPDSNSDGYAKCDAHGHTYSHANGYANSHTFSYTDCNAANYTDTYSYCYAESDTETTPNSAPPAHSAVTD